jgi:hypothetical protein
VGHHEVLPRPEGPDGTMHLTQTGAG